jgi:cardiolipin synthase
MVKAYLFPWRANNQFTLLVDAQRFFPAMLAAIDSARHFILFEQYLVKSGEVLDQFIQHLLQARQRGVQVYILLDDYGSSEVIRSDYQRLTQAGIDVVFYNPLSWRSLYRSLRRDHRKLLVVDNRVAFVGGAGISDTYTTGNPQSMNWHDVMLRIEGENVEDWIQSFMYVWHHATERMPVIADYTRVELGKQTGRVHLSRGLLRNDIVRSVIAHIHKSSHRVWLTTPYFVTNHKLRRALRRAAFNQVDVRLLLPGPISDHPWVSHAGRRYYYKLLQSGVKIFEYQPRFVHAKVILCDDWVSIGSSNLDRWNQRWNLDANQAVLDGQFSQQVAAMFESDFAQSRLITHEDWERRPLWQRFKERYFGFYVSLLHWFNYAITRMNKNRP